MLNAQRLATEKIDENANEQDNCDHCRGNANRSRLGIIDGLVWVQRNVGTVAAVKHATIPSALPFEWTAATQLPSAVREVVDSTVFDVRRILPFAANLGHRAKCRKRFGQNPKNFCEN